MQTRINISPDILRWVINHIRAEALSSDILEQLTMWLNGEKTPTYNQVEKVSKATHIPLGYFFLETPPKEDVSLVEYRTVDSLELQNPSRDLIDTIHDMDQIQNWMRNHLVANGDVPLEFVGSQKNTEDVYQFASFARNLLKINIKWFESSKAASDSFKCIRERISNIGVTVMMSGIVGNNTRRTLNIDEFRAFAMVDEYAPLIFINTNDSDNAKLFSLLHEFAHICAGRDSLFNDRCSLSKKVKNIETLCNAVAGEILVPDKIFEVVWNRMISDHGPEENIAYLAQYFHCGTTVIARKALDWGYIDYNLYKKIANIAIKKYNEQRQQRKEETGGNFYRTASSRIDHRFFTMLHGSVQLGNTTYSEAYRLTNTKRSTFSRLSDQIVGGLMK